MAMMDDLLMIAVMLIFPATMAFAAASDLISMTISNRLSFVLMGGFAVLAIWSGMGLEQVGWHVLAGASVLVVGFAMFAFGWIGGGDAKLAASTALWFGFSYQLVEYLLVSALFGGALTIIMLTYRNFPVPKLLHGQAWAIRLHRADEGVPYGLALAAGALTVYPKSWWMMQALGF